MRRSDLFGILGPTAASRLLESLGGAHIYFPVKPNERLCKALGDELAALVSERLGGECIELPLPEASGLRERVVALHAAGMRARDIAFELGCTERTVYRTLARSRTA